MSVENNPVPMQELELTTERLELSQDTFSRNSLNQLHQLFETLRELADKVTSAEPPNPPTQPIGFIKPEDKPAPKASTEIKGKKAT